VRITKAFAVLLAVISLLVLGDVGIVAYRLTSSHPASAQAGASSGTSGHPCNHGAFVSRVAHAHKGGGYVSSVAKGKLGRNGKCSASLPAAAGSGEGD